MENGEDVTLLTLMELLSIGFTETPIINGGRADRPRSIGPIRVPSSFGLEDYYDLRKARLGGLSLMTNETLVALCDSARALTPSYNVRGRRPYVGVAVTNSCAH